jgi:hypothetical protein
MTRFSGFGMFRGFLFALLLPIVLAQEPRRYPYIVPPSVSITREGDFVRVSSNAGTNLVVDIAVGPSATGPWSPQGSTIFTVEGTNRFFQLRVSSELIHFQEGSAGLRYIAVRLPGVRETPAFTTKSGFQFQLQERNWMNGIAIYRIVDGPATEDVSADFQKLFSELWEDERTDFVAPVYPAWSTFGYCFSGYTDEFLLRPSSSGYSAELLASHDLVFVRDIGGWVLVRWLKPKSMRLPQFLKKLQDAGIEADPNALGCPT